MARRVSRALGGARLRPAPAGRAGASRCQAGRPRDPRADGPGRLLAASYYERWLWSVEQGLLRKGTITAGEVEHMMERLGAGGPEPPAHRDPEQAARAVEWLGEVVPMRPATRPRFVSGQRVRVRRMRPAGHTRCPRYVRGALGVVEGVRGAEELPDLAVYSKDAPVEPVYSVALRSDELWGQARNSQEL